MLWGTTTFHTLAGFIPYNSHDFFQTISQGSEERVARAGLHEGDTGLCLHCWLEREDQHHTFFGCKKDLLVVLQHLPDLASQGAVLLDLGIILQEEVLTILSTGLNYICEV